MGDDRKGTVLVTGATNGLGRMLSTELAAAGETVLVHGRDELRVEETVADIRALTGNEDVQPLLADFASLAQVRALAQRVDEEFDRVDVLVNNAGIGTADPGDGQRVESEDGYELRFAVNYLASYLLTRSLLPLLERSAPARIVNVSSVGQEAIDFDDVMLERDYDPARAYRQSKLAQVMFTFDLADELHDRGVTATCLHPATFMPTGMVLAAGVTPLSSLEQGVEATLRLVVDPALDGVSGRYFDGLSPAMPHPQAFDPDARTRLRELSDRLCGLAPVAAA